MDLSYRMVLNLRFNRMSIQRGLSFFISIFFLLLAGCQQKGPSADLVLQNGNFFTVCERVPNVQAVAIKGDRILAVGSNDEIARYIQEKTRVINLEGKFGCPGFNDAHVHFVRGGMRMGDVDLKGVDSIREIQRKVLQSVRTLPPGSWLTGGGWDQSCLPDGKWPTSQILDVVAPDVPIFLRRVCGHAALVNRKAILIAGITADTPNPPGGEIVKNPETGQPTGILKEGAMALVSQYIPSPSEETLTDAVMKALAEAGKYGITSIQDKSGAGMLEVYKDLLDRGKLTCRISLSSSLKESSEESKRLQKRYRGVMLRFGGLDGILDGSIGAETAAFANPYLDDPINRGMLQWTQDELNGLVLLADKEGFQIQSHAVGDEANRMALDAYALTKKFNIGEKRRHRIEHAQVLSVGDIPRFQALGIVASMQPAHLMDDLRWLERKIGLQRCRYAYALKSLKDRGTVLAFGSDWPAAPLNPMLGIYAAVTRKDTTGYPPRGWFPQERIPVEEALAAYTLGSAYAEFMETEKGSLEPGKLADIVIVDRNLLKIPSQEILRAEVVYTILGGTIVYQREP